MIYIASDHNGVDLKKQIIEYLSSLDVGVKDMGPFEFDQNDDYPDFVIPTVKKVQEDRDSAGIVICKNGVGASMLANKFNGIRASLSWKPKHAASSKNDDDANVLALPAGYIDSKMAIEIVSAWLSTEFSNEERHKRRLKKVEEIES